MEKLLWRAPAFVYIEFAGNSCSKHHKRYTLCKLIFDKGNGSSCLPFPPDSVLRTPWNPSRRSGDLPRLLREPIGGNEAPRVDVVKKPACYGLLIASTTAMDFSHSHPSSPSPYIGGEQWRNPHSRRRQLSWVSLFVFNSSAGT